MKKLATAFSILTVLLFTACTNKAQEAGALQSVSTEEFKTMMEKTEGIILDVRTPGEVAQGNIPGSIMINYNGSDFEAKVKELDKSKTIYVYCRSGGRSMGAANILFEQGFPSIVNLEGGFNGWKSSGYPVNK